MIFWTNALAAEDETDNYLDDEVFRQRMRRMETVVWALAFTILVVFAVPWFLWGDATVVAGLPVWLWWHIGWMVLAAVVFYAFTRRAWDREMGIEPDRGGEAS